MSLIPANVYVTRRIPDAGMERLRAAVERVDMNEEDRALSAAELLTAVRGRDAIVCLLTDRMDAAVMDAAGPRLKVIANFAVGYNNVDVEAATARHIAVTNTPGVLTETTADIAWTLLLSIARRAIEGDRAVRGGAWQGWEPLQFLGHEVHGGTLGIVGAGRIGHATARRAVGFDMRILYCSRTAKPEWEHTLAAHRRDLDALLAESDFVSLHVPLTDETHHLIGAAQLARMKPTAYLINTSRGPIVNEPALVEALRAGTIAGAGLDVYEHEPKLTSGLAALDNVVLLPHIGSATRETRDKMALIAADNVLAALQILRPSNCVNPEVYSG